MMTGWFRRARQTRCAVTNREEARRQQRRAARAAYRTLGAIGLAVQLMLWVTLYAYDRLVQTTWQAARCRWPGCGRCGGAAKAPFPHRAGQR